MNRDLENEIKGLIAIASPTKEQIDELILGWERYFLRLHVSSAHQETEFRSIVRIRLHTGSISLVAPDLDKEFRSEPEVK